jgi:uncharacterized lipoprotein YbaY
MESKKSLFLAAVLIWFQGGVAVFAQFGFPTADAGDRQRDDAGQADVAGRSGFGWGTANGVGETRVQPSVNNGSWKLGVLVENTTTGVKIRRVDAGSPAASAGLEVGDVIVNVGGYQVGYVGGRLFDVGEEFRRRVDNQGRVELLVRDVRTNSLRIIPVGLKAASVRISGEIRLSDGGALPANSILQLQIVNRSRPNTEVFGGSNTQAVGNQRPIYFEMFVDPTYLRPGEQYELQAAISSGRQTLYLLRPAVRVDLVNSPDSYLRLTMTKVGNGVPDQDFNPGYPPGSQQSIVTYYQSILGRTPQQWEVNAWLKHFAKGAAKDDLPRDLLVSEEFYDKAGGNPAGFIDAMFMSVTGRPPNAVDRARWLTRFQQLGNRDRTTLVREFWNQYKPR